MIVRSKWLGLLISALVIASMAVVGFGSGALAAAPGKHAAKHASKSANKSAQCKTRNKPRGIIKYSDDQFPDTLSPYTAGLVVDVETLNGTSEGLFLFNSHGKFVTDMATVMPTAKNGGVTNGGRTYTVHLKKGLKWSDGQSLTAKDFVFGFKVGSDSASGPYCLGSCDIISRIDTPNQYTLVYHLKSPVAPFLTNDLPPLVPTSWPNAWSNDPHAAAEKLYQDTSYNFEGPSYPTNGAYQVTSFVNNDRVVLTPMKYYNVMNCGAYLSQAIFAFYATKAAMIAAAASHQTDVTQDYTADDLSLLSQHKNAYTLSTIPGFSVEHLEMNQDATYNGKPNPLHSANVRLAIALALDKFGIIRSALGLSPAQAKSVEAWTFQLDTKALKGPYADSKLIGQWDPVTHKFVTNTGSGKALADAKKLLAATQWKNGFSLDWYTTSDNPARQASEAVAVSNLKRIGITVNGNFEPASKLFGSYKAGGTLATGGFQMAEFAYSSSTPDPDGWKFNFQSQYISRTDPIHSPADANDSGIRDSLLTREFNVGFHSVKSSARKNAYYAVETEVNKLADWIPLYFRPAIATYDNKSKTFTNNPLDTGPEWNMFAWKLAS